MQIKFTFPPDAHGLCDNDFVKAYSLSEPRHSFVSNDLTEVSQGVVILPWMRSGNNACFHVTHFATDRSVCIEQVRMLCCGLKLESYDDIGRVLFRFRFSVRHDNHKRKGLASTIVSQEELTIARSWNAAEIHALVVGEGFLAWTNPKFQYELAYDDLLRLRAELARIKNIDEEEARTYESIRDFPLDFWEHMRHSDGSATFFKVIT